jgi:hypothetical protein
MSSLLFQHSDGAEASLPSFGLQNSMGTANDGIDQPFLSRDEN